MEVSILKVSNVPALVVTLSCAKTFDVPERFQLTPAVLLRLMTLPESEVAPPIVLPPLPAIVTAPVAPVPASARPDTLAPAPTVMLAFAKIERLETYILDYYDPVNLSVRY